MFEKSKKCEMEFGTGGLNEPPGTEWEMIGSRTHASNGLQNDNQLFDLTEHKDSAD